MQQPPTIKIFENNESRRRATFFFRSRHRIHFQLELRCKTAEATGTGQNQTGDFNVRAGQECATGQGQTVTERRWK